MNPIGVIVARFQTPYLHDGHKAIIDHVKGMHNKVVVVLGVSPVLGSKKNPLDFPTREKMLKKAYPDVVVLPLSDHPLDTKWSANLDCLLINTFPGAGFVLYGSRDSFIKYYFGLKKVQELPESGKHSATLIRQQMSDRVMDAEAFRIGVIYAYANMYTKVYPTVDIALFRNDRKEMLLGKKEIDQKWRLLGGFSNPTDNTFEDAALRELQEECGPVQCSPMKYEASMRVEDWRYRHEEDKIITTLFSTDIISGEPKGSDDIQDVDWFTMENVAKMHEQKMLAPEHNPQFDLLINRYLK